ncbi:NAD(P)/FAD-dependent oxidoreductase [Hoeflea sp. EC-HK425]|uniref:flavin-containing monooxygenase n=1 Tax=Hoeflea sp. EC-HK425 TaxID=2038388 RepID=UPI00186AB684|nr:NAD(P)/FAD-dependent oxidoreductase [Hoeflea sp. EC-HK425]
MNQSFRADKESAEEMNADAEGWLARLETALVTRDRDALRALFTKNAYWRDILAAQWDFRTAKGADQVVDWLVTDAVDAGVSNIRLDPRYSAPSQQSRAGHTVIEAIFAFDTAVGKGNGVARLERDKDGVVRASGFMTSLQELKGYPEAIDDDRAERIHGDTMNENWLDIRSKELNPSDTDLEVLIVGAGQCGLMIAARLKAMGVRILMVDRTARVGDVWRNRYHTLQLHNELCTIDFPYTSFPRNWPSFLPKDMYAAWMEFYAEAMSIPVWTETNLDRAEFDESTGRWTASLTRNGNACTLRPQHIVLATGGVSGRKKYPDLPGLNEFEGIVAHSADVRPTLEFVGKKVLVIGTSTSGHDIALELLNNGSDVTMIQRSPTNVVSIKQANLIYALYKENRSIDEVDIISVANDYDATIRGFQDFNMRIREDEAELTEGLEKAGFRTDPGYLGGGHFANYLHRGGGYYIDVGASKRIIDGSIKVRQAADIDRYGPDGALLKDGGVMPADVIVLATGYLNQEADIREYFGDNVADKVGPVWGWGEDGEMRRAWRPTGQEGLWLQLGGIPQARTFSKFLALQLLARLRGMVA